MRKLVWFGAAAALAACSQPTPAPAVDDTLAVECDRMQIRLDAAKPASGEYHAAPKPIEGQSQEQFEARVNMQKTMNAELKALYRAVARCEARDDG